MNIKIFILLFSLIFSINSCRRIKTNSQDSNTLNTMLSNQIPTFDPAKAYDTVSATVLYQCYETLYDYHYLKRPYTLKPLLAASLPKIENNNTRYVIKIKKNIQYHDDPAFEGKPRFVKAQDFILQIKRLAFEPTKSPGWWMFDNKVKGLNTFRKKVGKDFNKLLKLSVEGLKTLDDHTLVIELNRPYPQMINALAMTFTSPIPIEIIKYYKNDLSKHIIGTGPYKFSKWKKNNILQLTKFENFHPDFYPASGDRKSFELGLNKDAGKRLPLIDKINFYIIPNTHQRWNKFSSGEIDFLLLPRDSFDNVISSQGELAKNLRAKDLSLLLVPTLTYWWFSFNMRDPVWGKNKYLRLAIAHAINMDKYTKIFTNNVGLKANSIYPPGISGYSPINELPYSYDLKKARDFLEKAGHKNGKNLPAITYDMRDKNATAKNQAEYIKLQLKKINIKVNVIFNSFPDFLKKYHAGKLQFWQDGWSLDYPDAENVLQLLLTKNHPPGLNTTHYSNKEFDKLFNELSFIADQATKKKLLKKMEKIINSDPPWIMLYYARNYYVYHNYLYNFRHSDLVVNYMKYLRKAPH